jgi:hypothetical protein
MVTKNKVGLEEHTNFSASVWHCGDDGYFPFPLATALLIGDVMINRRSGVKMFLSLITAPIVLAHLFDFLTRRCYVNPLIHPANLIRHAYSRCEYVRANI